MFMCRQMFVSCFYVGKNICMLVLCGDKCFYAGFMWGQMFVCLFHVGGKCSYGGFATEIFKRVVFVAFSPIWWTTTTHTPLTKYVEAHRRTSRYIHSNCPCLASGSESLPRIRQDRRRNDGTVTPGSFSLFLTLGYTFFLGSGDSQAKAREWPLHNCGAVCR